MAVLKRSARNMVARVLLARDGDDWGMRSQLESAKILLDWPGGVLAYSLTQGYVWNDSHGRVVKVTFKGQVTDVHAIDGLTFAKSAEATAALLGLKSFNAQATEKPPAKPKKPGRTLPFPDAEVKAPLSAAVVDSVCYNTVIPAGADTLGPKPVVVIPTGNPWTPTPEDDETEIECTDCHQLVMDDSVLCVNCECCDDCCECKVCTWCAEPVDSICERCDRCDSHCECSHCEGCDHQVESVCENCENCGDCCGCSTCDSCGGTFSEGMCGDCEKCEGCCHCNDYGGPPRAEDDSDDPVIIHWRERTIKRERKPLDVKMFLDFDPVQSMAEFYLLSWMMAAPGIVDVVFNCNHRSFFDGPEANYDRDYLSAMSVYDEMVREARAELVAKIDPAFRLYVNIAVGGELRHHKACNNNQLMNSDRTVAWQQWISIYEQLGPDALSIAADLLGDGTMRSGFGGKLWAVAAKLLYLRDTGQIAPWVFVDRAFAMQHNGGSLLNKVEWARPEILYQGKYALRFGPWLCTVVGAAHHAKVTDLRTLRFLSGEKVNSMFTQWWKARNRVLLSAGLHCETMPCWQENMHKFPNGYDANGNHRSAGHNQWYYKPVRSAGLPVNPEYWNRTTALNPRARREA